MIDEKRITFTRHSKGLPDMDVPADMYFADFKRRIEGMIGLAENLCYVCQGGKPKEEWDEYVFGQFKAFRHQMLDIADEVGGLCDNMNLLPEEANPAQRQKLTGLIRIRKD